MMRCRGGVDAWERLAGVGASCDVARERRAEEICGGFCVLTVWLYEHQAWRQKTRRLGMAATTPRRVTTFTRRWSPLRRTCCHWAAFPRTTSTPPNTLLLWLMMGRTGRGLLGATVRPLCERGWRGGHRRTCCIMLWACGGGRVGGVRGVVRVWGAERGGCHVVGIFWSVCFRMRAV